MDREAELRKELKQLWERMEELLRGRRIGDVDLGALEQEWAEQPERHRILCRMVTIYQVFYSTAQAEEARAEALAGRRIRKKKDKYAIDGSLTEPMVKACVTLDAEVKAAADRTIDAKYHLDAAKDNVQASDHRKKALENEVSLWSQGYFAKPKTSRLLPEKVQRRLERNADRKAFNKKSRNVRD